MLHTPTPATAVPVTHTDNLPPPLIADAVLAEAMAEPRPQAFATLPEADAALLATEAEYALLGAAHTDAEVRYFAAKEEGADTALLEDEVESAHDAWCAVRRTRNEIGCAVLRVQVSSAADAIYAQSIHARAHDTKPDTDFDCYEDAEEALRGARRALHMLAPPPRPGTDFITRSWADQVAIVDGAWAAQQTDDSDEAIDVTNEARGTLGRMIAPDVPAMLRKFEEHLPYRDGRLGTNDDRLFKLLDSGDSNDIELATLFLDIERLCRVASSPTTFMPRATNRWLAMLGCVVEPDGFSYPDGCRGEVLQFLGELTRGQLDQLMAAAWIDTFLEEGGRIIQGDNGVLFGVDLHPGPASERMNRLMAQPEKDKPFGRLIDQLAVFQLTGRDAQTWTAQAEQERLAA